jgi:hypothetical protein
MGALVPGGKGLREATLKQVLCREQKSLARAFPWGLGEELFTESKNENSRRRQKLSVKNSSPRANRLALGEEFLRREFFYGSR